MNIIQGQLDAGKYTVLILDVESSHIRYNKLVIDGKEYKPVIVYDLPKSVAIEAKGNFVGKEIEFI